MVARLLMVYPDTGARHLTFPTCRRRRESAVQALNSANHSEVGVVASSKRRSAPSRWPPDLENPSTETFTAAADSISPDAPGRASRPRRPRARRCRAPQPRPESGRRPAASSRTPSRRRTTAVPLAVRGDGLRGAAQPELRDVVRHLVRRDVVAVHGRRGPDCAAARLSKSGERVFRDEHGRPLQRRQLD